MLYARQIKGLINCIITEWLFGSKKGTSILVTVAKLLCLSIYTCTCVGGAIKENNNEKQDVAIFFSLFVLCDEIKCTIICFFFYNFTCITSLKRVPC